MVESSSLRVFEPSSLRAFESSSLRAFESSPTRRRVGGWQAARCARRCSRQAQACRLELQRASRCPRQRSCSDSRRLGCSGIGNRSGLHSVLSLLNSPHLTSLARRRRPHTRHILGLYMVRHDVVPDAIPGGFGQVLAVRRGKGTHEQQLTGGVNSSSSSSSSTPTDALVRSPLALPPVRSSGGRGDGAEFRDHRERKAGTHSSSLAVPVPVAVTPTLTLTPSPLLLLLPFYSTSFTSIRSEASKSIGPSTPSTGCMTARGARRTKTSSCRRLATVPSRRGTSTRI